MSNDTLDLQTLATRLENLERVCASMAQERASVDVVEASAFVLRDQEGRVRAVLEMKVPSPEQWVEREEWEGSHESRATLTLFDSLGHPKAELREGVLVVGSGQDRYAVLLATEQAGARLLLNEGAKEEERSAVGLAATKDGPHIVVLDAQGFKTVIGNLGAWNISPLGRAASKVMTLLAGTRGSHISKQNLSAASLVMVDKDGEVIWRAF